MSVRILAFLQNPWFNKGTSQRLIDKYTNDPDFRRRAMGRGGNATGDRLMKAFSWDWYNRIIWDNASPVPVYRAGDASQPDPEHIRRSIERFKPDLILAFGRLARVALKEIWDGELMCCLHPTARNWKGERLPDFAQRVKAWVNERGGPEIIA